MEPACSQNDLVSSKMCWVLWYIPTTLLAIGGLVSPLPRMLFWTPALLVMGGGCVVNAARCGRLHCYMTGPLYLIAALATVLRYDLTYQYRLWPAQYTSETRWSLTGLLEANGANQWDSNVNGRRIEESDGHQMFLSPGLVLSGRRARLEAGLQVPVVRAVGDAAKEDNVRFVIGLTLSF